MKKFLFSIALLFCFAFLFSDQITFSAGKMKGSTGSRTEYTKLEKNASIKAGSLQIFADEIELNGEDYRYITASSSVRGKDSDSGLDFNCAKLYYDRETKIVLLEGQVKLVDLINNVKASAELIEFNQNTDVAIMQIGVEILSEESVCTSALAVYRKKEKIVELTGQPKVVRGDDIFQAQTITLDVQTEEITLDGKVRGTVSE